MRLEASWPPKVNDQAKLESSILDVTDLVQDVQQEVNQQINNIGVVLI